ncbi:MAG: heme exporter protein CcmD [Reyranellaceae bacterium]
MNSLSEFLAMGGHAGYVWPAFGLAFAILIGMALQAWLQRRRLRRQLAALQAERERP